MAARGARGLDPRRPSERGIGISNALFRQAVEYRWTSGIYFLEPNLHLMLEWVAAWDEDATPTGSEDHTFETLLSPGIRWAPYTKGDTQFAVGAGLPIGVSSDATDIALFLYMSFEHRYKEVAE